MAQNTALQDKPDYKCTQCGGDATFAYSDETIKRGKDKGKKRDGWGGLVKAGERLCIPCGRKRGINFW